MGYQLCPGRRFGYHKDATTEVYVKDSTHGNTIKLSDAEMNIVSNEDSDAIQYTLFAAGDDCVLSFLFAGGNVNLSHLYVCADSGGQTCSIKNIQVSGDTSDTIDGTWNYPDGWSAGNFPYNIATSPGTGWRGSYATTQGWQAIPTTTGYTGGVRGLRITLGSNNITNGAQMNIRCVHVYGVVNGGACSNQRIEWVLNATGAERALDGDFTTVKRNVTSVNTDLAIKNMHSTKTASNIYLQIYTGQFATGTDAANSDQITGWMLTNIDDGNSMRSDLTVDSMPYKGIRYVYWQVIKSASTASVFIWTANGGQQFGRCVGQNTGTTIGPSGTLVTINPVWDGVADTKNGIGGQVFIGPNFASDNASGTDTNNKIIIAQDSACNEYFKMRIGGSGGVYSNRIGPITLAPGAKQMIDFQLNVPLSATLGPHAIPVFIENPTWS